MEKIPPGRALDALIAEKVMGLEIRQPIGSRWTPDKYVYAINDYRNDVPIYVIDAQPYSTDISAAWKVIERLQELGKATSISSVYHRTKNPFWTWAVMIEWTDRLRGHQFLHALEVTAPYAICLAALEALELDASK